ncbi:MULTISPECIES: MspA family porin [unclassified Nocardia]|uniref:MspA family porin n=1 Tax=unclassified Nocardia TaxID=2637762 RepID=UPI001CE3EBF7|nr:MULTISPECIES: MspA family porin [unclassified Nocardia]
MTTDDGWILSITKKGESLDRYPALDMTPTTREGFVSISASIDVSGHGSKTVSAGAVSLGYQIGCQVDVSSGLALGLGLSIGPSVGLTVGPAPGVNLGLQGSLSPSFQTTLKPGSISTITFGTKPVTGTHGSVDLDQVEIKVDSCLGPVTIRSFATATLSTASADNSVSVYGDPESL